MVDFDESRRAALTAALTAAAIGATAGQAAYGAGPGRTAPVRMMRAYEIGSQHGIESLRLVHRPVPDPGHGEALVAVRAAALNHRDLAIAAGKYGAPKPDGRIPLGDGAGEVVAVGAGVNAVRPGDRVTAPHFTRWLDGEFQRSVFEADAGNSMDGWLAEYVLLPASALVRLPESIDFPAAAALGAAGITAWAVLETLGHIRSGDTVLTLGTGGVSVLALQIAKMNGARVAITSSSDAKLDLVRRLGADITVNYKARPDWPAAVLEATGGQGVDIVVETVGLATLPLSLGCCAPNARVGLLGALGGRPTGPLDLSGLVRGNVILKGITSGSRRMLDDLLRACAVNALQPRIDREFRFVDAVAGYRYLEAGDHVGKIVITFT